MKTREQEYFHSAQYEKASNKAAADAMQIARTILQDIMVHIYGMDPDHENVIWGATENNEPAFGFICSEEDKDKFKGFLQMLCRVKIRSDNNVWTLDIDKRAIILKSFEVIPELIVGIRGNYGGPKLTPTKTAPYDITNKKIKYKDLKFLDNRAYAGRADLNRSFEKALEETGTNVYRHFTYSLEDLEKSIAAFRYIQSGIYDYRTEDVFRFQ